jgi:hypothetical protein
MLEKILEWFPEDEILKADGFDEAVIGIDENSMRLIYSKSKCIEILCFVMLILEIKHLSGVLMIYKIKQLLLCMIKISTK